MKTILVTGAAGYLGSCMAYSLRMKGYEVIALDDLSCGNQKSLLGHKLHVIDLNTPILRISSGTNGCGERKIRNSCFITLSCLFSCHCSWLMI